jgi:hypothetical protein
MVRNNARQLNVTGPNVARSHTTEPARGAESTTQRKGQQAQSDSAGVGVQPSEPPGPDVTGPDAKGASEGGGTESSEGRGEAGRRRRARRGEDHDGEESSHTYAGGAYREWRECASAWVAEQLAEGGGGATGPRNNPARGRLRGELRDGGATGAGGWQHKRASSVRGQSSTQTAHRAGRSCARGSSGGARKRRAAGRDNSARARSDAREGCTREA